MGCNAIWIVVKNPQNYKFYQKKKLKKKRKMWCSGKTTSIEQKLHKEFGFIWPRGQWSTSREAQQVLVFEIQMRDLYKSKIFAHF